ncbi:hypothetical protein NDU88_004000 [Pleurodeles waltl]|uniref:Uncharacterized protein n=1 Tax=Pleurodeles waltl TaxID=8319 RepID=A0AAV7WV89_PLEWA|nr:hypothetical protein NDU88_004000 [Pleurodeles waltl]
MGGRSGRPGYSSPRSQSGPPSAPTCSSSTGSQPLPAPTPGHLSGRQGKQEEGQTISHPGSSSSRSHAGPGSAPPPVAARHNPRSWLGGPAFSGTDPGFCTTCEEGEWASTTCEVRRGGGKQEGRQGTEARESPPPPTSGTSQQAPLPPGLCVSGSLSSLCRRPQAADLPVHLGLRIGPGSDFSPHTSGRRS